MRFHRGAFLGVEPTPERNLVVVVEMLVVLVDVVLVVVLLIVEMFGGKSVFVSETVSNELKGFGEHVPEGVPPVHDSI